MFDIIISRAVTLQWINLHESVFFFITFDQRIGLFQKLLCVRTLILAFSCSTGCVLCTT